MSDSGEKRAAGLVKVASPEIDDKRIGPERLVEIVKARNERHYHEMAARAAEGKFQGLLAEELLRNRNKAIEIWDVCLECGVIFKRRSPHTCSEE